MYKKYSICKKFVTYKSTDLPQIEFKRYKY